MERVFLFLFISLPLLLFSEDKGALRIEEALSTPYLYQSVNVITGDYCESEVDLHLGGPTPLSLRRCYLSSDASGQGWHFNYPSPFCGIGKRIEGEKGAVRYRYDSEERLEAMELVCGETKEPLRWLRWSYLDPLSCAVEADDGRRLHYTFIEEEEARGRKKHVLSAISLNGEEFCRYGYCNHPLLRKKLVSRREESGGNYLINEYYDAKNNVVGDRVVVIKDLFRDYRTGRVKQQKAPVGVDKMAHTTGSFFYFPGYTEVCDALGNKTIYRYTSSEHLDAVENYLKDGRLYRKERFFWDQRNQLISRTVESGEGVVERCQSFTYDAQGNVTSETLWGNLSGERSSPLILNKQGLPQGEDVERYCTLYFYEKEAPYRLIEQQSSEQELRTLYRYNDEGKLAAKLLCHGTKIYLRYFYRYDPYGAFKEVIVDDGQSEEAEQIKGVCERRITRFTNGKKGGSFGKPLKEEEFFVDLETGEERLVHRTLSDYSPKGLLVRQKFFGSDQTLVRELSFVYDHLGRVTEIVDGKDKRQLAYDARGNVAFDEVGGDQVYAVYDYINRLVEKRQVGGEGELLHSTFRYDFNSNRIASVDLFGNQTVFCYDEFNRLISTTLPAVRNAKGAFFRSQERREYDLFDRVIKVVDALGQETLTEYNLYGKPTSILYPDGGEERFTYYLDGALKSHQDRAGRLTCYTYDFLGRLTQESCFSAKGECIKERSYSYNAFRKISEKESFGATIDYVYDKAGRLVAMRTKSEEGVLQTELIYDDLGNLVERRQWDEAHPEEIYQFRVDGEPEERLREKGYATTYNYDYVNEWGQNVLCKIVTVSDGTVVRYIYDALGRVDLVEKSSPLGQPLSLTRYLYDALGRSIRQENQLFLDGELQGSCLLAWEYDSCGRMLSEAEGLGTEKQRTVRYQYNRAGELEKLIKADGTEISYFYHPSGKIARLVSSDCSIDYRYFYDSAGHLVSVEDVPAALVTLRTYSGDNRLISEQLSNGLTVSCQYDLLGNRTHLQLPDGSKVGYCYKGGELSSIDRYSVDQNLHYSHRYLSYTKKGQLKEALLAGEVGRLTIERDQEGKILSIETPFWSKKIDRGKSVVGYCASDLAGSYSASFDYDQTGQLVREEGWFCAEYQCDSLYNRKSRDGVVYSVDGLHQLERIGETEYRYDSNGNLVSIANAETVLNLAYDPLDRLISWTADGKERVSYTYDPFGRRVTRQLEVWDGSSWQKQESCRFLYDDEHEIGAVDEEGRIYQLRLLGDRNRTVAVELQGESFASVCDERGSVVSLIDLKTGKTAQSCRYSAFGEETLLGGSLQNPWRYSGKRVDEVTGLVFFGRRDYLPGLGRWITKDPIGFFDSSNPFVFARNDPLTYSDLYGLFSFNDCWQPIVDAFQKTAEMAASLSGTLQGLFSCSPQISSSLKSLIPQIVDRPILQLCSFGVEPSHEGVFGMGEANHRVRITMINGALNTRGSYRGTLSRVSEYHGKNNIHYIYDASEGWSGDLCKAFLMKIGFVSPAARMLASKWKELIAEMGGVDGGGSIIHYAHSLGGMQTEQAKKLLTEEEQKMIQVITLGSASLVRSGGFKSVTNYVSLRDMVYIVDPFSYLDYLINGNETLHFVGSWLGVPFSQHMLSSQDYIILMRQLGLAFQEEWL